jgi:hypothetical protein
MNVGLRFAIREGGRTVGAGQVTEILVNYKIIILKPVLSTEQHWLLTNGRSSRVE